RPHHMLLIQGLARRRVVSTLESRARYPMVSRMHFIECAGNSAPMFSSEPLQVTAQALHGLASHGEWSCVLLSTLLDDVGVDPSAKWILAEGADSLGL